MSKERAASGPVQSSNEDGAQPKRYRFGSQFNAVLNASKPKRKFYQVDWRTYLTPKVGYVSFAFGSFFLMFLFGALAMRVTEMCFIQNAVGRCCSCVTIADEAERLHGQIMQYTASWNDIYYGVLMMVNSLFGVLYLYTGLKDENKFLLGCMVATQTLECARGLLDIALEPGGTEDDTMRNIRTGIMWAAVVVMVCGWVFLRPVYRVFGWKIFRQGGAKKSIRNMYKMYQRYRAANLLDIQSSFLIFLIFFLYLDVVRWHGYWVFICFFLCDIQASRYMLKYLKREDMRGVIISVCCKLFVISWWGYVIYTYILCYNRYADSRSATMSWWLLGYVPELLSVYDSYNGLSCLAPHTVHDARTLEVLAINFGQAMLFRFGSLIVSIFVCRNFGKGLRDVFYVRAGAAGTDESLMDNDRSMQAIGSDATERRAVNTAEDEDEKYYGEYSDEEFDPDKYRERHPQEFEDDD